MRPLKTKAPLVRIGLSVLPFLLLVELDGTTGGSRASGRSIGEEALIEREELQLMVASSAVDR